MNSKSHLFPVIVAGISFLTLITVFIFPPNIFGLISVITGTIGIILYYKGNPEYDRFFYAWVYMQFADIYYVSEGQFTPVLSAFPTNILPVSLGLGFKFILKNHAELGIYFNVLPFLLYIALRHFNERKPFGYSYKLGRLRKGTFPQIAFPLYGKVIQLAGRNKITPVYLVQLESEFVWKGVSYTHVHLEPQKDSLIETKIKSQVCGLHLCPNPAASYNSRDNVFLDWVTLIRKD